MAPASSRTLVDKLTSSDLTQLTSLLSTPGGTLPAPSWLTIQQTLIPNLPPHLLRPTKLLPRLSQRLSLGPPRAHLCPTHKPLNSHTIRAIFLSLCAEATRRNDSLAKCTTLPAQVLEFVKRVQSINSIWLTPEVYRVTFQVGPHERRFQYVESGCEACILAVVGGNMEIVRDLRTSCQSRLRKRGRAPRLLRVLDAWVDAHALADMIKKDGDVITKEVRAMRNELLDLKRQKRKESKKDSPTRNKSKLDLNEENMMMGPPLPTEETREAEQDTVGDIFDYYNQRHSSITGIPIPQEGMPPAFKAASTYSESVYSTNTNGRSAESLMGGDSMKSAEERAKAYRKLAGIAEEKGEGDSGAFGTGEYTPPKRSARLEAIGSGQATSPYGPGGYGNFNLQTPETVGYRRDSYSSSVHDDSESDIAAAEGPSHYGPGGYGNFNLVSLPLASRPPLKISGTQASNHVFEPAPAPAPAPKPSKGNERAKSFDKETEQTRWSQLYGAQASNHVFEPAPAPAPAPKPSKRNGRAKSFDRETEQTRWSQFF